MNLSVIILAALGYFANQFPCQQITKTVAEDHGFEVSWVKLTMISQELHESVIENNNCDANIQVKQKKGPNLQNILGATYVWNEYIKQNDEKCYEIKTPDLGFLNNNNHYLFQCILNPSNFQKSSASELSADIVIPPENKCGSSYYYAEIINNEVVFKNSCDKIIEAPEPN